MTKLIKREYRPPEPQKKEPHINYNFSPVALALVALMLVMPALWTGFILDDYIHRAVLLEHETFASFFDSPLAMFHFADGDPDRTRALMDLGVFPWWTYEGIRLQFFRPVAVFTHWLDYEIWQDAPALMHLHSFFWYGLLIILVTHFYRRIIGIGMISALSAVMFAIDDAHSIPAGWIANRSILIAAAFGVLCLIFHDIWRRDKKSIAGIFSTAFFLLALLSNEAAVGVVGYLVAYAIILDRSENRARITTLLPYFMVLIAWRIQYTAMGYGVEGSATYIDPLESPLRFISDGLLSHAPVLLLGQWFFPPSDIYTIISPAARAGIWIFGVAFTVVMLLLLIPTLREHPTARFWGAGMLLSLIPACATFPSDRLLIFVGLGAMPLVAGFIIGIFRKTVPLPSSPSLRRVAKILCVVLLIVHLFLALFMLPFRIYTFAALNSTIETAILEAPLDDEKLSNKTVVLLNAPNIFFTGNFLILRAIKDKPVPARIRTLGPDTGLEPEPIRVERTGMNTIVLEPEQPYTWFLLRDNNHPFKTGDTVELKGMTVTILEVNEDHYPTRVSFTFSTPLEAPTHTWLHLKNNSFHPYTAPFSQKLF